MIDNKISLLDLGWDDYFKKALEQYGEGQFIVGRVSAEYTHLYKIYTELGEVLGEVSGKMRFNAALQEDFPAIGDWVVISMRPGEMRATIHGILPRKSRFSRKVAGEVTREQIVASNIDIIFLVMSLNNNFNLRRLERYLTTAWESGASPVVVLSKADLCGELEDRLREVEAVAFGVPVHVISSFTGQGLEEIRQYINPGKTAALLGSSGVGKSTLINYLVGEEILKVNETSEFMDKGRHTTTHRELVMIPGGGVLIDTPGMKELQLWEGTEGVLEVFEDIEGLSKKCRFKDCSHNREPGCAIKKAIEEGSLPEERYENYKKLQKELKFALQKQEQQRRLAEKKSVRSVSKGRGSKKIEMEY